MAANRCLYPHMDEACRQPGVPINSPAPDFPVYFTVKSCPLEDGTADVWVTLNLFYEKDGAWCSYIDAVNAPRHDGDEGHDL